MKGTTVLPSTIAIDGLAASGKSTIGHYLARRLDYLYLDTGVLYRAVTWAVLEQAIPLDDKAAITQLAETLDIEVTPPTVDDGRQNTVMVGARDVTWDIRTPRVEGAVSPVSTIPGVRAALTQRMRAIGAQGRVVMVGRDIGTVVLPHADVKLFVVASAEERARRRYLERRETGEQVCFCDVLANIKERDAIDSGRETAPLKAADDATIFDTTDLGIEMMFARVGALVWGEGLISESSPEANTAAASV